MQNGGTGRRELKAGRKQSGMSMLLLVIILGMASVIFMVAFKLYPVFYDSWMIENVVDSFNNEVDLDRVTVNEIERRFQARMQTNGVRGFSMEDNVLISLEEDMLLIEVKYESRVPIYRNVDAVATFEKTLEKPL